MMNLEFKKATLEDRELIQDYLMKYPSRSCERCFSNVFLWSRKYNVTWGMVENTLVFKTENEERMAFTYPAGRSEDIKKAITALRAYCKERGRAFGLYCVTPEYFERLNRMFPDTFQIEYERDDADYVYESEKLITLAGKKLHGKRNHINKFKALYEGRWAYETMTKENIEDCFQMQFEWRHLNEVDEDPDKRYELAVVQNALRLFSELGFKGGLIRIDGKVVAFTMGEALTKDTFCVHFEKALADVEGAYPMINQQFVEHECASFKYINREEDTGAEGLRKAKLSYKPVFLVEKGFVTEIEKKDF
ncbi:MAG: phosphatidylglycerol lysyltransferase domain-containing protein [Dorea sp.]|nr:phosphatidylglycerol lysyltransferase domain-containing protein [Dorea sp.]